MIELLCSLIPENCADKSDLLLRCSYAPSLHFALFTVPSLCWPLLLSLTALRVTRGWHRGTHSWHYP